MSCVVVAGQATGSASCNQFVLLFKSLTKTGRFCFHLVMPPPPPGVAGTAFNPSLICKVWFPGPPAHPLPRPGTGRKPPALRPSVHLYSDNKAGAEQAVGWSGALASLIPGLVHRRVGIQANDHLLLPACV